MALNKRQRLFVKEYLIDRNATEAAKRAGYSERTAYSIGAENLKKPEIKKAIAKAQAEREQRTEISADYVLKGLRTVADRCMQAEQVLDKEGTPIGEWRFNASGANRALELIGKHLGMFEKQKDDSGVLAVLERMAAIVGTVNNPQPQRSIEDFEE